MMNGYYYADLIDNYEETSKNRAMKIFHDCTDRKF